MSRSSREQSAAAIFTVWAILLPVLGLVYGRRVIDPTMTLPFLAFVLGLVGAAVHTAAFVLAKLVHSRSLMFAAGVALVATAITFALVTWLAGVPISVPLMVSHMGSVMFLVPLAFAFAIFVTFAIVRKFADAESNSSSSGRADARRST